MTKEALKLALEALVLNNAEWKHLADSGDSGYWSAEDQNHYKQTEQAIAAVQRALANEALEKMAENARELGLDYEPEQDWIERERAVGYREGHMAALTQRTWVGLTYEEVTQIIEMGLGIRDSIETALDKLKEKNESKN